ncbi:peptide chain release factor 2 [Myxococcota bacterium]|nr:peptide chain release factor 2 [Myxococcota bacterium]
MAPEDIRDEKNALSTQLSVLRRHLDVDGKLERLEDLERQANLSEFWADQARAQKMLKEKGALERVVRTWQRLNDLAEEIGVMLELADEAGGGEDSRSLVAEAEGQLNQLRDGVRAVEIERLLGDEGDENGAILEINSGAGGTDAADWAEMLKRMYLRWAERRGFKTKIVDEQLHEEAGIKSCSIEVQGAYAYGYLRAEIGVHRLVRISPFDAQARRHTAFASVAAYPDVEDNIEIEIRMSDLRVDTYRASGAGGQHVNMTDSAVRLTHLPTGTVVACQAERSQHKNKDTAMKMLRAKLYQLEIQKRQEAMDAVNATKKKIEWGSQIRSYVLQPYRMVKDTRTGMEMGDTDRVLDGDITGFMESWLAHKAGGGADAESGAELA